MFLFDNSWSCNLIDSDLTESIIVQTFCEWDCNAFTFRSDELFLNEFKYTSDVFRSFICDELCDDFDVILFSLVLDSDLLVKYELIGSISCYFVSNGVSAEFEVDPAWKLDLKRQAEYTKSVGVNLYFPLDGHIKVN